LSGEGYSGFGVKIPFLFIPIYISDERILAKAKYANTKTKNGLMFNAIEFPQMNIYELHRASARL
jgi:hypothetical protein